jgi:hypothetical protein
MIGLNGRGQAVLRDLGVMDRIDQASSLVLGRMDWQPDIPPDSPKLSYYGSTRTYKTRCIQRDRLASCLLQELREKYSSVVSVTFGACCVHADWTKAIPEDDIPEVSWCVGCGHAWMYGPLLLRQMQTVDLKLWASNTCKGKGLQLEYATVTGWQLLALGYLQWEEFRGLQHAQGALLNLSVRMCLAGSVAKCCTHSVLPGAVDSH